jgi:hypothetical protein
VTFLVNIWLNYRPFNVNPLPNAMLNKLTKVDQSRWSNLFSCHKKEDKEECISIDDKKEEDLSKTFTWPMGDCNSCEAIQVYMPLTAVRHEASLSGNIQIKWRMNNKKGVCLFKNYKSLEQADTENGNTNGESSHVAHTQSEAKRMKVEHGDGAASK